MAEAGAVAAFTAQEFRRACGQFLTGVTIVTTRAADGTPVGITANAFTSVSLVPPLILVCLDKKLISHPAFLAASAFGVHVLSDRQAELSTRFATRGADKFAGLAYEDGLGGLPRLGGGLAVFECRLVQAYSGGDHTILIGQVERLAINDVQPPLGFFRRKYVTIAPAASVPDAFGELWALGWG